MNIYLLSPFLTPIIFRWTIPLKVKQRMVFWGIIGCYFEIMLLFNFGFEGQVRNGNQQT
jgi:hypothetical protein